MEIKKAPKKIRVKTYLPKFCIFFLYFLIFLYFFSKPNKTAASPKRGVNGVLHSSNLLGCRNNIY